MILLLRSFLLLALFAACPLSSSAQDTLADFPNLTSGEDWPWWRGPNRNGFADPKSQPPVQFGNAENVKWKTRIPGRGHSSPVVVASRVFLATADERSQTHSVLAVDLKSGQTEWTKTVSQGGFPAKNHPKNTEASPTIASDGESLFVTFYSHQQIQLSALTLDGQLKWQESVGPFNPKKYEYGYAPSPVIFEGSVIVAAEWDGRSNITAFDRQDGRMMWQRPRPESISFSSPVVARVAGRQQLFLSGIERVSSYDPASGKPLWEVSGTTAATCGTMIWDGDLVFASGGYPKAETLAVLADGSGRIVWRNGLKCYEQSMIVVDGYIYALTDRGVLYCLQASNGKEMWRERLAGPVSASPVYAGGNIYWANEAGTFYVFRPNPTKFELIAENRLGNQVFASPAVVGNQMLVRVGLTADGQREEYLYCIGE